MDCLINFLSFLSKLSPLFGALTTVFLGATLFFVYRYTKAQTEEVGLRKRPVVSVWCRNEFQFYFQTAIQNFSHVHAKARFEATIRINGKTLMLPDEHHYAGKKKWHLQARGLTGLCFGGHLNMEEELKNNDVLLNMETVKMPGRVDFVRPAACCGFVKNSKTF